MDCIFCRIAAREIPSNTVYEDDKVIAFTDIAPQAPVHILIVPKTHIMSDAGECTAENSAIVAHIFVVAAKIARDMALDKGFRVLTNVGEHAGQTVQHLHFHLLGGRELGSNA